MKQITIGVVLDSDFEFGVAVYEGIRRAAAKLSGWNLAPLAYSRLEALLPMARSGRMDGIILPAVSDRWVAPLHEALPALVNTSNISRIESVACAVTDDAAVGALAAAHLSELGVRRCGVISERALHDSTLRREGFCRFMERAGIEVLQPDPADACSCEDSWERWLRSLSGEISIYGTSDRIVGRFLRVCARLEPARARVAVGAVVGTGNSPAERVLSGIDLTSVVLPGARVGAAAVGLMRSLLAGEPARRVALNPDEIVVRSSSAGGRGADDVLARARGYIESNVGGDLSVEAIARYAGVSRRTLEMRFRRHCGCTPAEYVRQKRMRLADRLLADTDMTVGEVARRCGAGSQHAFTAAFRACRGTPPARYRAEQRGAPTNGAE